MAWQSRARVEQACDKLKGQGQEQMSKVWQTYDLETLIRGHLLSRLVSPGLPMPKLMLSTKPHHTGCHVWREVCEVTQSEVTEIKPDVIVECYLDAKYYHYNPAELNDLHNVSDNFKILLDCDEVLTINQATMDTINACTSIDDNNFKELDNACPTWEVEIESVNPKWVDSL